MAIILSASILSANTINLVARQARRAARDGAPQKSERRTTSRHNNSNHQIKAVIIQIRESPLPRLAIAPPKLGVSGDRDGGAARTSRRDRGSSPLLLCLFNPSSLARHRGSSGCTSRRALNAAASARPSAIAEVCDGERRRNSVPPSAAPDCARSRRIVSGRPASAAAKRRRRRAYARRLHEPPGRDEAGDNM